MVPVPQIVNASVKPGSGRFTKAGLALLGAPDPEAEYRMPDLSDLFARNMLNVALDAAFGGWRGPTDRTYAAIWVNLVRLTDAALREYEGARSSLATYGAHAYEGRISSYYRALDHFETCVDVTHRGILNAAALVSGAGLRLQMPTDRQRTQLRKFRNTVQHLDERLVEGKRRADVAVMLVPLRSRMVVGRDELPYRDLASCITKLYRDIESVRGPSK